MVILLSLMDTSEMLTLQYPMFTYSVTTVHILHAGTHYTWTTSTTHPNTCQLWDLKLWDIFQHPTRGCTTTLTTMPQVNKSNRLTGGLTGLVTCHKSYSHIEYFFVSNSIRSQINTLKFI